MTPLAGPVSYRRKAIINRVRSALDAFYLLQRIDWEYDGRATLEKILGLAMEELEFEGGKRIERALLILDPGSEGELEIEAGWGNDPERLFSRTVVHETINGGRPILCENAKEDPRFMAAESLKRIEVLSLIAVPLSLGEKAVGALYIESSAPKNIFRPEDVDFLLEFSGAITPHVKTALTHRGHVKQIQRLRAEIESRHGLHRIIGRSAAMRSLFELCRLAARGDRTVLITGESGTGKEMVAQAIHTHSTRAKVPLVVVDCSGLSENILESELFGHAKGALTGATADKIGAFEEANGGSIFLDEISDAPRSLQQKLRRVLQEGEIRRVGDSAYRKVDVRVICATNRSLPELVERGEFIRDLYFRINKFPLHLPPLRDRREDITPLVHHFISEAEKEKPGVRAKVEGILPDALETLLRRDWRENNIRELRNTVELAVDLATGPYIELETLARVARIQRGEAHLDEGPSERAAGDRTGSLDPGTPPAQGPASSASDAGPLPRSGGLVQIDTAAFRSRLEKLQLKPPGTADPSDGPFYRAYLEFAARAIIEGLRACGWKLRPAARLLGISPMKLRGELKVFIEETVSRANGDLDRAAQELSIPANVLRRKASDFGIEGGAVVETAAEENERSES